MPPGAHGVREWGWRTVITVETWPISQFDQARTSGILVLSPEYQRRPVWSKKDQMLLMDSVARGVPIGAITLYVNSEKGYDVYEVIDGKQRLGAIESFLDDSLSIKTSLISSSALDDDEFNIESDEVTGNFHDKEFSKLATPERMRILQYKIPIFVVQGERAAAIRAFARMNRNTYTLKPQEIRNAFFSQTSFLDTSISVSQELDLALTGESGSSNTSVLVGLGAISRQSWDRMQDVQFISELLTLLLHGPQHRRDTLDYNYSLYRNPTGEAANQLKSAAERLQAILVQLWELTEGASLQAFHFPAGCENDVYGLVGALHARGLLTKPQMDALQSELITVVSTFRASVEEYVAKVRKGESPLPDEFDPLVEAYGRGFLGGQTNAKSRREDRIAVWAQVVNGVVATLDPQAGFTETQRRLIWARSSDKVCARCHEPVAWEEFHAGHKVPWSKGGRTTVENGRVEHASCNMAAGATS
jgi:hypothetical protein